jgi:hypothetical protein
VISGAFDSTISLDACTKLRIYDAWGEPMVRAYAYETDASGSWTLVCKSTNSPCNPNLQWVDPKTAVCRRKALMAVLASSEIKVIEMTLFKSDASWTVSQSIELRLKDGEIAADPDRIINWNATAGNGAHWLLLSRLNGSLHSAMSVATIEATVVGTGLGDTATTGPLDTSVTFQSGATLMNRSDFLNGTDVQTISVRLSIVATPFVNATHVTITRSSDTSDTPVDLLEPIEAGEKLTVSVKAFDFEGMPITRADLQLFLDFRGKLNKNHSTPLQLKGGGTNVYTATIVETWIRDQETVQSDVFAFFLCAQTLQHLAAARAAFRIHRRAETRARTTGGLLSHAGCYFESHVLEGTEDRGA